jgi:3-hydroxy-9,10-secoandrosta-1,3,5(10)-triene-9,17-dione monooxygenase reductase component
VTIHSDHPFLPPEDQRSELRRLRGRLPAAVTVCTAYSSDRPAGLTVSSILVADGDPGRVLILLDPDSELVTALRRSKAIVVNVLGWDNRELSDAFAGITPAPGGPFRLGEWQPSDWGPVLVGTPAWAGCRLVDDELREVGWSLLVEAEIEHIQLGPDAAPLAHRRGRYFTL